MTGFTLPVIPGLPGSKSNKDAGMTPLEDCDAASKVGMTAGAGLSGFRCAPGLVRLDGTHRYMLKSVA